MAKRCIKNQLGKNFSTKICILLIKDHLKSILKESSNQSRITIECN